MKSRVLVLLTLVGLLSISAVAQTSGKVVKVKPEKEAYAVRKGASVPVAIVLDIDGGYHINSNRPLDKFLIATVLKMEASDGITPLRVAYPRAKLQKFSFSEKPMSVYEGRAVLAFTVRALPAASAGKHDLRGKLTIQACNNEQCLRPQTVDVAIPIDVN